MSARRVLEAAVSGFIFSLYGTAFADFLSFSQQCMRTTRSLLGRYSDVSEGLALAHLFVADHGHDTRAASEHFSALLGRTPASVSATMRPASEAERAQATAVNSARVAFKAYFRQAVILDRAGFLDPPVKEFLQQKARQHGAMIAALDAAVYSGSDHRDHDDFYGQLAAFVASAPASRLSRWSFIGGLRP